jgi:tripartite-type tricarboxylate transporter receptor subunit TctC
MNAGVLVLILATAALVAGTPAAPGSAQEAYPTKPIELIIPFAAGGSHDLHARVLASVAPQYLGQGLVVVLKPGAGGAIASQYVARARGDGYTLLFGGNGPNTILPQVQDVGYKIREFTPVAMINYSPPLLTVKADAPWRTVTEYVEFARTSPGRVNFAHTGVWGAGHFPMLMVEASTGAKVNYVPFDGGGPALLAVASGNADAAFLFAAQVLPFMRAGRVRVLGVAAPARIDPIREIPTLKEQGVDVSFTMWRAVLAPSTTPVPRVRKLREALAKTVEDASFKALMRQLGEPIIYMDGPAFLNFWRNEWDDVGKTLAVVRR